ncbi:MAG: hypothetical protein KAS32_13790 [Candidatus Peribacteraceae bacterium]|nr:hypothetical protein [Candidatus Peribacteraceae bacterium]
MNNEQRDKLSEIIDTLTDMESEEREKFDNAPEGLEDTERVLKFEENADSIQEAIDALETAKEV